MGIFMDEKAQKDEINRNWNKFQAWRAKWAYLISLALLPIFLIFIGCFFFAYPSAFSDPQVANWALLMISLPAVGAVVFYVIWRHYQN